MSSMNKIAWKYTDEDGNTYVRAASQALVSQGGVGTETVGGSAGSQADPAMPSNLKPRYALVVSATGIIRKVVCYENTAPLYTTPGTTITLETGGADVVFTRKSVRGEKQARKISQAA